MPALDGLRILDLTRILAGPTCTQLLGDLGADVIKIERPGRGDDTRTWGPPFVRGADGEDTSESAYYLCANRNKRSVAVDLATAEGAELVRRLAARSDVLIENFKVGALQRYGLGYDDLKDEFPGLVYCSITGFGQTGPNAHRAGYDLLAQGYGGIMSLTGEPDGEPMKVGVGIADIVCGMYAATAILAALRHRDRTGRGQHIDLALVDTQMAWLVNEGTNYLTSGELPRRRGNEHPNIVPYGVFETADGHVIVAVGNDAQYERFCEFLGAPELASDERYRTNAGRLAHREELVAELARRVRKLSNAEVLGRPGSARRARRPDPQPGAGAGLRPGAGPRHDDRHAAPAGRQRQRPDHRQPDQDVGNARDLPPVPAHLWRRHQRRARGTAWRRRVAPTRPRAFHPGRQQW